MKIKTTELYEVLDENQDKRLLIFQGSSRSGKTYNILIWLVVYLLQNPNITLSIVRKTLPALKGSVLKDLQEILEAMNIYDPDKWRKQEGYYEFSNGSIIEWFSTDESQKLRGRKRDVLFINEANEISRDDYVQLAIRTKNQIIMDYNPSDLSSYIYDLLDTEENVFFHKSTYKDNPFISEEIIKEIENLKYKDENLYRVFALGERGISTNTIFTTFNVMDKLPYDGGKVFRGLDFGYNDPTAIVEVRIINDNLYIKELLYSRGMTTEDIYYKIKELNIPLTDYLWCDSSRPEMIEELRRLGVNARSVKKNTILHGIDMIKRHYVHLDKNSPNLIDEFKKYSWKKDKDGNNMDVPEDDNNHLIDAIRYCLEMSNKNKGKYILG